MQDHIERIHVNIYDIRTSDVYYLQDLTFRKFENFIDVKYRNITIKGYDYGAFLINLTGPLVYSGIYVDLLKIESVRIWNATAVLDKYDQRLIYVSDDDHKDLAVTEVFRLLINWYNDFFSLIKLDSRPDGIINTFGIWFLFEKWLYGELTSSFFDQHSNIIDGLFAMPTGFNEPSQFFELFGSLLKPDYVDIDDGRFVTARSPIRKMIVFLDEKYILLSNPNSNFILWSVDEMAPGIIFPLLDVPLGRHLYFTFNHPHWILFRGWKAVEHYGLYNVYRTWRQQLFCSDREITNERRLHYGSLLNENAYDMLPSVKQREYILLSMLCGMPSPVKDVDGFVQTLDEFSKYLSDWLDQNLVQMTINFNYYAMVILRDLPYDRAVKFYLFDKQFELINESRNDYIVGQSQMLLRENFIVIGNIQIIYSDIDLEIMRINKKTIVFTGYNMGTRFGIDTTLITSCISKKSLRICFQSFHHVEQMLGHVELGRNYVRTDLDLNTISMNAIRNFKETFFLRGVGHKDFKDKLEPKKLGRPNDVNLINLDRGFLSRLLQNVYRSGTTGYTTNNGLINTDININFDAENEPLFNASTMKLLSMFIECLERAQPEREDDENNFSYLCKQFVIMILGTVDEPLRQMLRIISHNNWVTDGIGRNAVSPNKQVDFENFVPSKNYTHMISDIEQSNFQDEDVNALNEKYVNQIMTMIRIYYAIVSEMLIIKINVLLPLLFQRLMEYFGMDRINPKPYIIFLKNQFSPYMSGECFLIIFKQPGFIPKVHWDEDEIKNIILGSGVYTHIPLTTAMPYIDKPLQSVVLLTDNIDRELLLNIGKLCVLVSGVNFSDDILSFGLSLGEQVKYGKLDNISSGLMCAVFRISLKKVLLRMMAGGYTRALINNEPIVANGVLIMAEMFGDDVYYADYVNVNKSYVNAVRYIGWKICMGYRLPPGYNVYDVGGRDLEGIIFCTLTDERGRLVPYFRHYNVYDPNLVFRNPNLYHITIVNEIITMDGLFQMLPNGIVLAINSMFMVEGESRADLLLRLRRIVNFEGNVVFFMFSVYVFEFDIYRSDKYLSFIAKYSHDLNGDYFTFGQYKPAGTLSRDDYTTLCNDLRNAGYTINEILVTPADLLVGANFSSSSVDGHACPHLSYHNSILKNLVIFRH